MSALVVTFLSHLDVPNASALVFKTLQKGTLVVQTLMLDQLRDAEADMHILKASQISVNSAVSVDSRESDDERGRPRRSAHAQEERGSLKRTRRFVGHEFCREGGRLFWCSPACLEKVVWFLLVGFLLPAMEKVKQVVTMVACL